MATRKQGNGCDWLKLFKNLGLSYRQAVLSKLVHKYDFEIPYIVSVFMVILQFSINAVIFQIFT